MLDSINEAMGWEPLIRLSVNSWFVVDDHFSRCFPNGFELAVLCIKIYDSVVVSLLTYSSTADGEDYRMRIGFTKRYGWLQLVGKSGKLLVPTSNLLLIQ